MSDRKYTLDQTLLISSLLLKVKDSTTSLNCLKDLRIKREDRDILLIFLADENAIQINRKTQEVSFNKNSLKEVFNIFGLILKLKDYPYNALLKAISLFLKNKEELIDFFLSTKNKIYIEKEENVQFHEEGFLKEYVFPMKEITQKLKTELSVLDCFFIRFKTGEIFNFSKLSKHPLGILLPWEMISEKKIVKPLLWSKQVLRSNASLYEQEDEIASKIISSLSTLLLQKKVRVFLIEKPYADKGYSLSFTGVFKTSKEILKINLKDVLFDDANLSLSNSILSLNLNYTIDLTKVRMMDSVFHIKESNELFITKEDEIRENIKDLFSADHLKFQLKSLSFDVSKDSLKKTISYNDSFYQRPIEKIKKLKELLPVKISHNLNMKTVDSDKLNLIFSNIESSKVELKYPNISLDPDSYFITRILKILLGLKGGLAAYLQKDAANIAVKGDKRLSELKLLKSSGFFSLILIEVIAAAKEKSKLNKTKLWAKLDKVILKLTYTEATNVSKVVSSFFIQYVDECIHDLFEKTNYEILQVLESEITTTSSQKNVFDFIEPLIKNFLRYYKNKIFSLDNFQNFEINPKQSIKEGLSIELNSPCPLNIGSFIDKNNCIINQKKIKVMQKDILKAEIKVLEKSEENKKIDWFELNPKYYFDGVEITEEEAKVFKTNTVVQHNDQLYFIPEKEVPIVTWLNHFWDKISLNNKKSLTSDELKNKDPQFYRSHILDILALRQTDIPVKGSERWEAIAKEYDFLETKTSILDENFKGKLKAFQEKGVSWLIQLYRIGLGGVLADDMGLGKTIQILSFLNHLNNLDQKRLHLIVVPTSLIHNWKSETKKFTPNLNIFVYKNNLQNEFKMINKGIILVTYGLLTEHQKVFQSKDWDVIVFDEAQQLKNIKSLRSQSARNINAKVKICLSGTPMENHYGEFYSLIDLSVPGALGEYSNFIKIYGPRKINTGSVSKREIDYLKLKSKPLILRRTKDEVLKELPDKTESIVKIDFDDQQKEIYKNVALSWNSKVQKLLVEQGESKSQIQMFAALMKLRQVCSCPDIIVESNYKVLSPKLSMVIERVEELLTSNKSVLIFTNFILTLDNIKKELKKKNLNVLSITGKDSQKKREKTLNEFNKEGHKALVMTLKTGGVGLNLTKANYIIHVEPWWNPAAENQGTDRVHRIGQKQSVHVYRYIMSNSIEEKIQMLKDTKQEAFNLLLVENTDDIISTSFKGKSGLTKKDFEYLLS